MQVDDLDHEKLRNLPYLDGNKIPIPPKNGFPRIRSSNSQ